MNSPKHSPKYPPNPPAAQHSTTALNEPDRRRHARYTVHVPIEILREDNDEDADSGTPLRCETADLSCGGCYIQLDVPLPVGIRLHATLWLDDCPIVIRGLIVTRHPEFGNGIMFVDFEGQGQAEVLLKRYLDGIAR